MRVFELIYPGAWLQGLPDQVLHDTRSLLSVMEDHLADAAVGLRMFQETFPPKHSPRPKFRNAASQVKSIVETAIENGWHLQRQFDRLPPMTPEERHTAIMEANFEATRLLAHMRWDGGQTPDDYAHRVPFIHAHTVLYALDGVSKALGVLAKTAGLPKGVRAASDAFSVALPSVVHIRDSAHHLEDRARGRDKDKKPLALQPIDTDMIKTAGSALIVSSLSDNRLGYTLNDGSFGEVEISEASVESAQIAIQAVLNALDWRGPKEIVPRA